MRRRNVLAAGAVGAAALVAGATSAEAAPLSRAAATRPPAGPGDMPWTSASLRDLAARVGLRFGSALIPQDIETPSYAAIAGSQFSVVTPGNAMKWQIVEPEQGVYDWSQADQLMSFARAHDQLVRGHTLIWHNQLPTWLLNGVANKTISSAQLMDLAHKHITTEVSRYRGRIWQWDVCNEFFTDTSPSQVDPTNWWIVNAGPEIIPNAYRWAHEADPHALLFYNDYNIGGEDGTNATAQEPTDNLALFAQPYEYSEILKAALAVPQCISFTVWGFTDSDSWVPGAFKGEGYAGIYDVNQKPKAAYYSLQSDLALAAFGAPRRVPTSMPRA
jgi:endo-1,4-beta-xylanase